MLNRLFRQYFCITSSMIMILLASNLHAEETTGFTNVEDLSKWITFYYKAPTPSRVTDAFLFASKNGLFKEGKAAPPFFGFLSGWLAGNWASAEQAVEKLSTLPTDEQPVLILGLWYSNTPNSKLLLQKSISRMPSQEKMVTYLIENAQLGITEIPLEQGPWVLDALWGNFMATGNEAPIIRIISALSWANIKGDVSRLMVGNSAKWSLTSNAIQHPRVLEICRSERSRQPDGVITVLSEIILKAEKELEGRNISPLKKQ